MFNIRRTVRSTVSIILCIMMTAGIIPGTTLTALADPVVTSGSWTDHVTAVTPDDENIYEISTAAELAWVARSINEDELDQAGATFKLMNDIDLSAHYWKPIGLNYGHRFTAAFDGNAHKISGMYVGTQASPYNDGTDSGLFGYMAGSVRNLRITDSAVYAAMPDDNYLVDAGLLAGRVSSSGVAVKNCDVSGTVGNAGSVRSISDTSMKKRNAGSGGIAGEVQDGTVEACRVNVSLAALDPSTDHYYSFGGIAGTAANSDSNSVTILNCVSAMTLSIPAGMSLDRAGTGAAVSNGKKCQIKNTIARADLGGAAGFEGTIQNYRSACIAETNFKSLQEGSYVAQSPRYTYYGSLMDDPVQMTEEDMKQASFVTNLNTKSSNMVGLTDPLEWSIDEDVNDGFPNLAGAGLTAGTVTLRTVTFMSGGRVYKTSTVENGNTVSQPSDPAAPEEGMTFLYWYADDPAVEYDFSAPVTKSLTLTARWMGTPCTVRFDSKGGSYVYPVTVSKGEKMPSVSVPQKKGYSFVGWYTDSECTTVWDFDDAVSGNMTLYAKWGEASDVSVSGRITDANSGKGIRSATVKLSSGLNAVTDEFGYYRIADVPSGSYTITASAYGYTEASEEGFVVGSVSTGYDAALSPAGGGGGGGGAATVNVYTTISCVYSGIMLDGVEIKAVGDGNLGTYTETTSNGGLATFVGIPAGNYTFHINESGRPGWESYVSAKKNLSGDHQLNCALKPNYQTLKVNVIGTYDPISNKPNASLKGKQVTLTGVDPKDEENELINITAYTDDNGSVTVQKLVPITWKVSCSDFAYEEDEATVTSDGAGKLSEEEVTLTLPFIDSSISVDMASVYNDPDLFKKTDENKDNLPVVTLAGVAGTMTEGIIRSGQPDASGKVIFTGLFPGNYNLSASGRVTRVVDIKSGADGLEIFSDPNDGNFSAFGRKHFDIDMHGNGTGAVALGMRSSVTLEMDPSPVSFSGILYKTDMDEKGGITSEPLKNAKLLIKPSAYYPQSGANENGYEITTDNTGHYAITMAPGLYGVEMESAYNGYFGGKLIYHEGHTDGYVGTWGWPCTGLWTGSKASAVAWMTGDDSLAYGDIGGMSLSSGTVVADLEIMEKKINYSAGSPGSTVIYDNLTWYNLMIGREMAEEATQDDRTTVRYNYDYYENTYEYMNYHPDTRGAIIKLTGDAEKTVEMTGKTFPYVFHELSPGDYGLDYTISDAFSELESSVSWGGNIKFFDFPSPGKLPYSFPEDYAENGNPWPLSTKNSGLHIDAKDGRRTFRDIHDSIQFKFYNAEYYGGFGDGGIEQSDYERNVAEHGGEGSDLLYRNADGTIGNLADGVYPDEPDQMEIERQYLDALPDDATQEQIKNARNAAYQAYVAQHEQWENEKEARGFPKPGCRYEFVAKEPYWDENYDYGWNYLFEEYLVGYSTSKIPDRLFYYQYKVTNRNKPLPDGTVTLYFCAPKGRGFVFLGNLNYIRDREIHEDLYNSDLWFSVTLDNRNKGAIYCDVNFLHPDQSSSNVSILAKEQVTHLLNPRTIAVKAVEKGNPSNVLDDVEVTVTYANKNFSSASPTPEQTCFGSVTEVTVPGDEYEWECLDHTQTLSSYDDGTKTETFYVPFTRKPYSGEFVIKDDAGNPVANASITLTGKSVGQPITLFTGPDGKATAYDCLTYQDYDVHVTCPGYSFHNITLTAEDVRSDEVATDVLRRDEQPEFDEDAVSINRKGAFLPGVNFSGSSNSIDFLIDTAITAAKDKPLYYTVNAKIKTAPLDSLLEVFLIDKRTFRNPDFGDVPEALATPAMDENNYNPSLAWEWGAKLEKGELGNVYYRRFSGDEPFVSQKDSHGRNVYEIEKTLPLWELPPDGFEPCLLAVTSNHAMQIYDFDYSGEAADDQLVGIRLDGDKAGMLNNITLLANAQALGGPAVEKLEELTEPTGSIIPLPSFEAGIEEEDGFLSYDYTVEMQLLQGKKSVSDAEKSYMAILPSTLGIMAKGGWKMGVDGEERKVTNSFHVTVAGKDMDALDYLPSAFEALPVKVEFDEDNPPSGTITLAAADTKDKNNHNTEEEYSLGINGQVHIVAEVSAFSSFAAVLPVGPVLASLEKSGALDIGAKVQVAVGADGTYKYKIINGEEQESEHEVEFTLGAGAGIGFYAKAFGGALGAEANLKLTGDNDKLQDMVTVSASIGTEHGFKMNRIDGKVLADAHIEMKTWLINGEKDFKFVEIPFSYQFGTETMFTLTEIQIEDNLKSRNDFEPSTFNGRPESVITNLLPIGGYATDEDGAGTFVYTDMSKQGGNVRLMLSAYAGNKVWITPVAVTATAGLIPGFDVISKGDEYIVVWSEIAAEDMMKTCPPSVLKYSVGKISNGAWTGSTQTLGTLPSEVATKLLLVSDANSVYLTALKTAEGVFAEKWNVSGYKYTGSGWSGETVIAQNETLYDISACAAAGTLFVSYVTDDKVLHAKRWSSGVTEKAYEATGFETALASDDTTPYLVSESEDGLTLRSFDGGNWVVKGAIDNTRNAGNPSLAMFAGNLALSFTDGNAGSLYRVVCGRDGGILDKRSEVKKVTSEHRFRNTTVTEDDGQILIFTVSDGEADDLAVYGAEGSQTEPVVIVSAPKAIPGLTYTREAQRLVSAGTADGGRIRYAVVRKGEAAPEESDYKDTLPTAVDAGTYSVYYKPVADQDHSEIVLIETPHIDVTIGRAELSSAMLTVAKPVITVNGAIPAGTKYRPELVVKDGADNLIQGRDYRIDQTSDTVAGDFGTYLIRINGMGNYMGVAAAWWKVMQVETGDDENQEFAHSVIAPVLYDGTAHTPDPRIIWMGQELEKNVDYTLTYKNNVNAAGPDAGKNAPAITVKGKGRYKNTMTFPFTIQPRNISDGGDLADAFTYTIEDKQENGKVNKSKPVIRFTDGAGKVVTLKENKDYTLAFRHENGDTEPKAAGLVTVSVTGMGNFTGRSDITYQIIEKSDVLKNAVIAPIPDVTYKGRALTQEEVEDLIQVYTSKNADAQLVDENCYTVSFNPADTMKTGKVTVSVHGTEGCGELWKTATFKIVAKPVMDGDTEQAWIDFKYGNAETYTGAALKTEIEAYDTETGERIPASNYTVKYTNNTNAAEEDATKEVRGKEVSIAPTATVTFKGNYKGTLSLPFTILPIEVDAEDLSIVQADLKDRGKAIDETSLKPTVKYGRTTLKKDKDYRILDFAPDMGLQMQTATVELFGNYAGEKDFRFRIYNKNSVVDISDTA
ncbi:MAG: carboxypeptidase regulatory-like domain-containing protein, partial [Lachnospiraceae bacterium]|nr:carboxypeptidase regulatory-like domain-containing protein [Lachnospiraceae bacterium]